MKRIFLIAFSLLFLSGFVQAKPEGGATSASVFKDDGDFRIPLSVSVNSNTATSPYEKVNVGNGSIRSISIQNVSDFDLLIGTFSRMNANTDKFWFVSGSSGTWTSFNSATFYMLLSPSASTITVRGLIEKQK